jgi:hypothetical protein
MDNLILAIKDWPVLIQGAIGSGLFWLFLLIGQKLFVFIPQKLSALSKSRKESILRDELFRFYATRLTNNHALAGGFASILLYRASRHLVKAIIWLTFGLVFDAFTGIFGTIGFIGSLYYLFGALNVIRPNNYAGDIDNKIKEIEEEITSLQKLK